MLVAALAALEVAFVVDVEAAAEAVVFVVFVVVVLTGAAVVATSPSGVDLPADASFESA